MMSKDKIGKIRAAILDEYRLGANPLDASMRIQKMFGLNFETRSSTIRMWFEQFYLGDESLENDPFREDLLPTKRETRQRNCTNSSLNATNSITSSLPDSNSNDTQTKLLFQLKDQVDILYRKINAQDCCLKLVDRFIKKLNQNNSRRASYDDQSTLKTFCSNYQFLRKKCQNNVTNKDNFYEILYNNMYPNKIKKTSEKKDIVRKSRRIKLKKRSKPKKTSQKKDIVCKSKTMKSNKRSKSKKRNKSRATKQMNDDSEWPKLPIQSEVSKGANSLRCPFEGCSHLATSQRMFTIHYSTHLDPSLPICTDEEAAVTCDQCGKVLKNHYRLKIHTKQIHKRTKREYCPFEGCDVSYSRQNVLRLHIQIVHTKDARVFRCSRPDCHYSSYNRDLLNRHLRIHSGERAFKCIWPGCDKAFKSNANLAFHKSIHENKRKYKCQWIGCGYACNLSHNLKKHTAIHERKQMADNER